MNLCIRAHDLGVTGIDAVVNRLEELGAVGAQLVCYKVMEDVPYAPGAITPEKAAAVGKAFRDRGLTIPFMGAYFNPVHSDREKTQRGMDVFSDYLRTCRAMGCNVVGSETGSFNDDRWTYHPRNRTEEGLQQAVRVFTQLREVADSAGSSIAIEGAVGHVCWNIETVDRARKMIGGTTKVVVDLAHYLDENNQGRYLDVLKQALDTFGDDILLFHLKDCVLENGKLPRVVPYGTGELDIPAILGTIKAFNPNATLVLEETAAPYLPAAVETVRTAWASV